MNLHPDLKPFLTGALLGTASWPLVLYARCCDLRRRFLPKGQVGRGHRAIARNGRILLASDRPLHELAGQGARIRVQTWHRAILPRDLPRPYGVLLCVRCGMFPLGCEMRLHARGDLSEVIELGIEVGGGLWLEFQRLKEGDD